MMSDPTAGLARLAIGIDLGGTQVRAALVDAEGSVHARATASTDVAGGPRAVLGQIERLFTEVTRGVGGAALAGVGVSAPGPLDSAAGVVLGIPTLPGWVDIPIAAWLHEKLQLPIRLQNDGVAAATGEWRFGAGRGLRDFVYITVSTGIGGGVVADGQVLKGHRQLAAHVGHMITAPQGEVCRCGNRGCWEAQAAGPALGDAARKLAACNPGSSLAQLGDAIDARQVFAAARTGDELALQLVAREAELLGIGIVNLVHLYSPAMIVIGGGVSHGFDLLLPGIEREVRARALPPFRDVPVARAVLEPNSGLIGAASLMLFGDTEMLR
jgi:glucokinase